MTSGYAALLSLCFTVSLLYFIKSGKTKQVTRCMIVLSTSQKIFAQTLFLVMFIIPLVVINMFFPLVNNGFFALPFMVSFYIGSFFSVAKVIVSALLKFFPKFFKGYNPRTLEYSGEGTLNTWYDSTYEYLSKSNWIDNVCNQLLNHPVKLLDIDKENYIFVSPSANKGRYEKEIALKLAPYANKLTFIVSDIEEISNHESSFEHENVTYNYLDPCDAFSIQETLNEIGINLVNCIWDRKGCAWYSVSMFNLRNRKSIEKVFETYFNVLDEGGIIIFDAENSSGFKQIWNNLKHQAFNEISSSMESSTYQRIKKYVKRSRYIQEHFDKYIVGEGIYRIVIFRKRL